MRHISMFLRQHVTPRSCPAINNAQATAIGAFAGQIAHWALLENRPMNTSLRVNEALLIAGRAFQPFQCVAWQPQDGSGAITLAVIDRTNRRLGQAQLDSRTYADPAQLADAL